MNIILITLQPQKYIINFLELYFLVLAKELYFFLEVKATLLVYLFLYKYIYYITY